MNDQEKQSILDQEHLRLLRIGYIVAGSMDGFMALIMLVYVLFGILMVAGGFSGAGRPGDQAFFGMFFVIFGLVFSFMMAALSALKLTASRSLGKRRSRLLCQIAAGASCLQTPWGVLLGVFTFIVLGRESVKPLFEEGAPAQLNPASARAGRSLFDDEEVSEPEKVHSHRL